MPRYPLICAALLAGCGAEPAPVVVAPPPIDPGLLQACPGWQGPAPRTEGELIDAAAAERRGRLRCNAQLNAIEMIVNLPNPAKGGDT